MITPTLMNLETGNWFPLNTRNKVFAGAQGERGISRASFDLRAEMVSSRLILKNTP